MDHPFDAPPSDAKGWQALLPDGRVLRWADRRKAVWIARRADAACLQQAMLAALAAYGWSHGRVGEFPARTPDCKMAVIASGPHACVQCYRCTGGGILLAPLRLWRWRGLVRVLDEVVLDSLDDGPEPAQALGSPPVACP